MSLTDDILMHYGMPRRSGRYPWGSGDNPYQHSGDFLSRVEELKKSNFTFIDKDGKTYTGEVAIAKSMGLSTTQFRTQMSLAKDERRSADVAAAKALRAKGYSLNEIADKMGFANDSSVRSLLNESSEARMNQAKQTAEFLKKQIAEKGMIDVGTGVERELGISKEKMNQALYILEMEGYPIYGGGVPQVTNPGKQTNIKVLCPPGTEHKEIYNFENVHSVRDYVSHDDGETFDKFVYPKSMDSSRLKIRYAEDGGIQKDGVIEIRRGVDDLSLGDSHYAQVRILVDGNRYLKGMAVYSDDLPDGVDVMPCSLGADLSQGDDFCAFTFLFPLPNGSFGIKTRNYITSTTLMKLPAAMRIKYDQFMAEGSLIVLEGAVLNMMDVYEDLDNHIQECGYDVRCLGFDPYNAKEFVARWESENGPFGIEKVIQGAKTESVPLGELKKLSEERMLIFDEDLMTFAMGNCITLEDTNGNRKLLKKRYEQKIDAVAAMMDAYIAYKLNRDAFE